MSVDPVYRMLPPADPGAQQRAKRLRELGIKQEPDPEFDEFARQLAVARQAPYAMVNIVGPERQFFAGLYPSSADRGAAWQSDPLRSMACDHGYCMHVVARGHAMALPNVLEYARHAVNPVVSEVGVRAYLGAPLVDLDGMILGTVCVLDTKPRPEWDADTVAWIKERAAELTGQILLRAGGPRAADG
jgi:GAF domain-containing protein